MVPVSRSHSFTFLKTRKTASASIDMLLETLFALLGLFVKGSTHQIVTCRGVIGAEMTPKRWQLEYLWQGGSWNHMSADSIRRSLGESLWSEAIKITSVHNLFERLAPLTFPPRHKVL